MLAPDQTFRRAGRWLALAASAALLGSLIPLSSVAAAGVTVISATGGSAISADTNATDGTSTATTLLTGPSIVESAPGDIASDGTITVTLPSGFQFAAASSTATPNVTSGCGLTASVVSYSGTTNNVATTTVSGTPSTTACTITFTGLRVIPSTHTVPTTGDIAVGGTAGVADTSAGTLTEVAGAAHTLTFTQAPSTFTTGGLAFSQQPIVQDLDQYGNPRVGALVSLSIISASVGGASLSCAANPVTTNTSGNAVFSSCSIDKVGVFSLRAADSGVYTPIPYPSVTVQVGAPDHIAFTGYPAAATTTSLGGVTVAVVDKGGNVITNVTGNVALAISANGTSFSCSLGTTRALSSGAASFGTCTQSTTGIYTLTVTGSSLAQSGSPVTLAATVGNSFQVTSGPASRLAFCWGLASSTCTTTPSAATAGTVFPVQPAIVVQDVYGNTVTSDSTTIVTLSIGTTGTGGTLTCATGTSITVTAGIAYFSGCSIDKIGSYQLTASSSPYYTPVTSNTFSVVAGPPTKLTFTAQPTSGAAGQAFPIQPVVAITDAGGNVSTSSTATVTLSLAGGTVGAVLSCTGGLTQTTVSGVAYFSGCSINTSGTSYYLMATATSVYPVVALTPASTNVFNVTLPPAQITVTPSATVIKWATAVTLTTQFGTNGANRPFVLQASLDKVHWYNIASLTTNSSGTASFSYTPATNLWYQAVYAGATDLGAATTTPFRVVVRQIALLRPTNAGKVVTITSPTTITWHVTVRPNRPELPRSKVGWKFYIYRDGHWVYLTTRYAYTNSDGIATYSYTFGTAGAWYVRAQAFPTPYNANSGWSPVNRYNVR